jgi:hypothetical protein
MQHPTFSATLAEQHRDKLRRHAQQARLARGGRLNAGRLRRRRTTRWWRPATQTASA